MRHEHLVVTVESGTKERIEEDLDPGETVEAWVADAIDEKLADDDDSTDPETNDGRTNTDGGRASPDGDRTNTDGDRAKMDRDRANRGVDGGATDPKATSSDRSEEDDGYDEGFEYVDDCSI